MLKTFANVFKIPELRSRVLFTIGLVAIARLLAMIPIPGIDWSAIQELQANIAATAAEGGGGIMNWLDTFSGGALTQCSVGTMSIWPYISASIIIQLMTAVVPALERLSREGDAGRKQITLYTRWLTIGICLFQSAALCKGLLSPESLGFGGIQLVSINPMIFYTVAVISMLGASMFVMWLADQITARGVGNGVSLIIMINITSRLPQAITEAVRRYIGWGGADAQGSVWELLLLLAVGFIVLMGTVAITQGMRKIPLHSTRQVARGSSYGGGATYLPLRVNFSGVMPIIFAGPLLMIIPGAIKFLPKGGAWDTIHVIGDAIGTPTTMTHIALYAIFILFFCFFWVATQFNAMNISDSLKRDGSYVPGVAPGMATAEYLDSVMTRVTLIGAIALVVIAILPLGLSARDVPYSISAFFGGTSLLIIVGVALDTLRQMESHLLMRNYDGFLKHGRLQGRR